MTELPNINVGDLYHIARKGHFEAKQKGQESHTSLAIMGACLTFMGATMLWKAFNKGKGFER